MFKEMFSFCSVLIVTVWNLYDVCFFGSGVTKVYFTQGRHPGEGVTDGVTLFFLTKVTTSLVIVTTHTPPSK